MVWKFDLAGNLLESKDLGVEGMQQGTKVPEKNLFHNIKRYISNYFFYESKCKDKSVS